MPISTLKQALDRRGLPQSTLCGVKGLNYPYACRQYRGEQKISAEYALIYERLLGIPRYELRPDLWPAPESADAPKGEEK